MNQREADSVKHLVEPVNKVLEKFWSWTPRVGDYCLWGEAVLLITDVDDYILYISGIDMIEAVNVNQVIPILEWEVIEGILEKGGYASIIHEHKEGYHAGFYMIEKVTGEEYGKSRQEAVMKAVIELGKDGQNAN